MNFSQFALTSVLMTGMALAAPFFAEQHAAAQSPQPTGTSGISAEIPVASSGIDINRLPIDIKRIEQRFRQGQIREERDGLNLRYFVEVFALSPKITLFTKEDNLEYGRAPYGGPTHSEMMEMMTPREYRNHGGANILNPKSKK